MHKSPNKESRRNSWNLVLFPLNTKDSGRMQAANGASVALFLVVLACALGYSWGQTTTLYGFTTTVQFNEGSPSPTLIPLSSNGNAMPEFQLQVEFLEIAEIYPNGSAHVSYPFSNFTFLQTQTTPSDNSTPGIVFGYSILSEASIVLTETYHQNAANLSQGGIQFTVNNQTLKITIQITNWPFKFESNNSLALTLQARTGESTRNKTSSTTQLGTGIFNNLALTLSTDSTLNHLEFLDFAAFLPESYYPGPTPPEFTLQEITIDQIESNETVSTFIIIFPGPFYQVIYDPNFGVVLTSDGTNQGGGDGGSILGVIIGVSVGVPVAAFVVVVVILAWHARKSVTCEFNSVGTLLALTTRRKTLQIFLCKDKN